MWYLCLQWLVYLPGERPHDRWCGGGTLHTMGLRQLHLRVHSHVRGNKTNFPLTDLEPDFTYFIYLYIINWYCTPWGNLTCDVDSFSWCVTRCTFEPRIRVCICLVCWWLPVLVDSSLTGKWGILYNFLMHIKCSWEPCHVILILSLQNTSSTMIS